MINNGANRDSIGEKAPFPSHSLAFRHSVTILYLVVVLVVIALVII